MVRIFIMEGKIKVLIKILFFFILKRKTFLENPNDPSILLRLPMTKAAVKAMDAMTEFSETVGAKLTKFMVAGASKVRFNSF